MLSAWRIVKAAHADLAFSGEGARRVGGRWNSPGVPMVYTSEHKSLAVLEMLAHLYPGDMPRYLTFRIEFEASLVERWPIAKLPPRWREEMPAIATRLLGDAWARENRSAALAVPSAIIPEEFNFLLNPNHPDFAKVKIAKPTGFAFDSRLL
jgi:RES domain-containing protein